MEASASPSSAHPDGIDSVVQSPNRNRTETAGQEGSVRRGFAVGRSEGTYSTSPGKVEDSHNSSSRQRRGAQPKLKQGISFASSKGGGDSEAAENSLKSTRSRLKRFGGPLFGKLGKGSKDSRKSAIDTKQLQGDGEGQQDEVPPNAKHSSACLLNGLNHHAVSRQPRALQLSCHCEYSIASVCSFSLCVVESRTTACVRAFTHACIPNRGSLFMSMGFAQARRSIRCGIHAFPFIGCKTQTDAHSCAMCLSQQYVCVCMYVCMNECMYVAMCHENSFFANVC
jgi:hypothetical protein